MRIKIRVKGSTAEFVLVTVPPTFEDLLKRCSNVLQLHNKDIQLFVSNSRVLSLDVLENLDEVEVCQVNHPKLHYQYKATDTEGM